MPVDAKTIQIYLPDGEPRGIRIAEITTRIVQAVQVPRVRLDRIMKRDELDHTGVYFLFGETGDSGRPVAYIGQTEDFRNRLKKHHETKEFWTTAVLLISKTNSFTLAHIKYLEWHAIKKATEVNRYVLDNGNASSKPFIPEPLEADVLDAFETGSTLLSTLGFPIFEPVISEGKSDVESTELVCVGPSADGKGRIVEDGFVVLKGSQARKEIVPSAVKALTAKRAQFSADSITVDNGSTVIFTQDFLFNTPSAAAEMILGRRANGWVEWKTSDGRTLDEIARPKTLSDDNSES